MQTTSQILMIRPVNFGFNTETAVNNAFQIAGQEVDAQQKALKEFDDFVAMLRSNGIQVLVINDTAEPYTPDSIFPNNWISFHDDGAIVLYPMYAQNRRLERKEHVISSIQEQFQIAGQIDLTNYEVEDAFLEGTGSMVLDRDHKVAYACLSPRTNPQVLQEFCQRTGYSSITFIAIDCNGREIYHTNVMMCIADQFAVVCLDCIRNTSEQQNVVHSISKSGKDLISISIDQMNHFAGNMLQVENLAGDKFLVMSSQAFESLDKEQIDLLSTYNNIIHSPLNTIETNGGGSARCMMAEIHLTKGSGLPQHT